MKFLFEDQHRNTAIMVGLDYEGEIEFTNLDNDGGEEYRILSRTNINLEQAYELSSILSKFISKMEDEHRKKLPLWKRIF